MYTIHDMAIIMWVVAFLSFWLVWL